MISKDIIYKTISTLFLACAFVFGIYWLWPEKEVIQPQGVFAPGKPTQIEMAEGTGWTKDGYFFDAVAHFSVKAKVISKSNYYFDDAASICPTDLALGWGRMSDQEVVDKLEIWQAHRWYKWKTDMFPIPKKEIESSSANMHIIPGNAVVEDVLKDVALGNIIEMQGYLVNIRGDDGWQMVSSVSRTDRGGGACEVVWVEKLRIIQ